MYIVMNRLTVHEGRGPDLEAAFARRANLVQGAPGFIEFRLLRPAKGNTYISMSRWESREAFENWTRSPAFAEGHRSDMTGVLAGRPVLEEYEVAL